MTDVRIGIIGGGLMGRELAAVCGRWLHLVDHPVRPAVVAVADLNPSALEWFRQVPTIETLTESWRELVDDPSLDVLYIAVPHNLHEEIYTAAATAGKDFFAEKPFGIDFGAAERIAHAIDQSGVFVRVSSEMPFFPGALRVYELARSGQLGEIIEVRSAFLHSSDIDRGKPINWKRRVETCGAIGVMGDLGMHVAHVPLRLGYRPSSIYALLEDIVFDRPAAAGSPDTVRCDTWDNAIITMRGETSESTRAFPMIWETKRIAPGNMNTWVFEAQGMDGGVRFSTRTPAYFERFRRDGSEQIWEQVQPGNVSAWPMVSGAIFEFGFADALLQMWASYLAERAGELGDRFATATVAEAVTSHRVFAAALRSQSEHRAID
ncbi:MAG: Gfo/Idh/MocA family protein [Candidatus Nanopelagicales bacterium]